MPVFQEGPKDKLCAFSSLQLPIYEESKKKKKPLTDTAVSETC